jgi:superfamily II DNA or RNA helicase
MSATPERSDGFDIFEMFDYNVAYEIRLHQAMKERMICPFHYFGISELSIDGKVIEDKTEFNKLTSDERVRNVIEKIEHYGYSGNRVKGLIFCSRKEEAVELSIKFNNCGYRTCALLGIDNQLEREFAIKRLEQDDHEGALDYIFTVDIFNEGVDIPAVNQIVMLRPTQSAIIFVQQLGRGLRKKENKEYVVVIDFIGNYEKNFFIPIALSGDQTYNKDTIRRFVTEGNRVIPGCSTVNFDAITRERIYSSIDQANFNDSKLIKESYLALKQRLGRIPRLDEFARYGSVDVIRIFDKFGSYHNFLKSYEKAYTVDLSTVESTYIEFISTKYANGKRPHELEFVKLLVDGYPYPVDEFKELMKAKYPAIKLNKHTITCVLNQMMQKFATGSGREK